MLLTCLLRGSRLTLNTDLGKLASDMRAAAPDYFLNVPALLERMRKAVDEQLWQAGGLPLKVYSKAKGAWARRQEGKSRAGDGVWLGHGEPAGVSDDSQEDDWQQAARFDLRVGAVERGDSALLLDARDSRVAGVWADRDDGDLHDG